MTLKIANTFEGPWEAHVGEDYAVVMLPGETTDSASIQIFSDEDESLSALVAAIPDLLDSLDPETLEAIAAEIECFEHSARAASLRGIAKRQREALAKAVS